MPGAGLPEKGGGLGWADSVADQERWWEPDGTRWSPASPISGRRDRRSARP